MPTPLEYEFMAASLCPTAPPRVLGVMLVDEFNRIWGPNGLGGHTLAADPVGGGGGGATTFSALTDKATADLPATNTPLATALSLKAPLANPTFTGTVSGITSAMVGLGSVDNTSDVNKPLSSADVAALALKAPLASPTFTGTVAGITASMVGLANVNNTSDANKPLSSADVAALALKAPLASPTFTGTVAGVTAAMVGLGSVDNTSDANKPLSSADVTALALKANLASPTFTGTVAGITSTMVGLGSVDNTSDANKPVSTATSTALGLKADLTSPTLTGVPAAPTAALNTSTTQLATTAFVAAAAALKQPLNARVDIANQTANVTLTAATTVDVVGVECLAITQTTASVTITLPVPTTTTLHRAIAVENVGSVAVTVAGADSFALNSGESRQWRWNGTNWKMVGTLNAAQTAAVQGLVAGAGIANMLADGRPCFLMGGDHPYAQWRLGFAPSYAAAGIKSYLAINTDSDANGISPGQPDMLTWSQIATLSSTVEMMSHGARHIQSWERINTGVSIVYTGANGTATVACSTTTLTITDSGATTFTLASYTLATLKAAVEAVTGWSFVLAAELAGTESAKNFSAIGSTSVKTTAALFACGGGIVIKYNGSAYRDVQVRTVGTALRVYGDGVRLATVTLTSATITSVVTALNAAVTGLVCQPCDNRKSDNSAYLTYVSGGELCDNLKLPASSPSCVQAPIVLQLGLPQWYMVERQFVQSQTKAAANGVTLANFANSGNDFVAEYAAGHQSYKYIRGNQGATIATTLGPAPAFIPTWMAGNFTSVFQLSSSYGYTSTAQETAAFDALADSDGFMVCALLHKVLKDGTSPYDFTSTDVSYYDITETNWTTLTANMSAHVAAGRLLSLYPSEIKKYAAFAKRPSNLIFNPKFKTSGESALNLTNNQVVVPGWILNTLSANYSAVTVDSANANITLTCANGTGALSLGQCVMLEPGKTYNIGVYVQHQAYASGAGVGLALYPQIGRDKDAYLAGPGQTGAQLSAKTGGVDGLVTMRVTMPTGDWGRARVISSATFPVDMSVNKNINLNIYQKGGFDIDCSAGAAIMTAVQAHEAAAAINAAIKANIAVYAAEFQNCARAENGKLVIETPRRSYDQSYNLVVVAGTALSITTVLYGSTDVWAVGLPQDAASFACPLILYINTALSNGAGAKISNPFITEWSAAI